MEGCYFLAASWFVVALMPLLRNAQLHFTNLIPMSLVEIKTHFGDNKKKRQLDIFMIKIKNDRNIM